jgi:heat shock protein HtpX
MLKLYRPKNVIAVTAYYAAAGSVLAGAVAFGQVWALATAGVLFGGLQFAGIKIINTELKKNLIEHEASPADAPRLGEFAKELYQKTGLKSEEYPVYDFALKGSNEKGGTFDLMSKIPNAGAVMFDKPLIMMSKPLLKLLGDEEEKAVLAHEFAHAAARHHWVKAPATLAIGIGSLTLGLTGFGYLFTAGFAALLTTFVGAVVVGGVVTTIGQKIIDDRAEQKNQTELQKQLSPERKYLKGIGNLSTGLTLAGLSTLFTPLYVPFYAATTAIKTTFKVINARFSQHHEFQADRGAVVLGADPLALITALRKITIVQEQSLKAAVGDKMPKKGALMTAWKKATSTHPTLEKRIARLQKMAKQQGRSDADITAAVKGAIHVPNNHNIPYAVIEQMVKKM